jgi:hypothetical protein
MESGLIPRKSPGEPGLFLWIAGVIKWANYRVWRHFTTEFSVISLPSLAAFYYRVWQILV